MDQQQPPVGAAGQQFVQAYNIAGINLFINPMLHGYLNDALQFDGNLIRSVNLDSQPLGAKQKRPGYVTLLDTADGSQVNSIFSWTQDSGTQTFLYRFSGTTLYYYNVTAGSTGTWTPTNNTANFAGTNMGHAILDNVLIVGDGMGSTCHTTDGINFTNTILAPVGQFFCQYQNRIYLGGTTSTIFFSTTGDATNWNIAGTSDSSSFTIPDSGKLAQLFVLSNTLNISKNSGKLFFWDAYNLYDSSSDLGPSSPYSYASIEGVGFWLHRLGIMSSQGQTPSVISNPIEKLIFNPSNTGISGTSFGTAPGVSNRWDYYVAVGSVQDDFTAQPLNNAIIKYNYQKNEFLNYQFYDPPTAFGTYLDTSLNRQLVFGGTQGQVFQFGGTAVTDNGQPIASVAELVFTMNQPHIDKDWRWFWAFFNPGCEAQIQVALSDTFTKIRNWIDIGQAVSGVVKFRFPTGSRSKLLWVRVKDNSRTTKYTFYGASISAVFADPG